MNFLQMSFGWIGTMGPFILIALSCLLLAFNPFFLMIYILGTLLNVVINLILKGIIRQDRPKDEIQLFELGSNHGKRYKTDRYGMPSGHSQSVGFSLAYIVSTNINPVMSWIFAIISMITLSQRYIYRNHTFAQIMVGFIVGNILGYTVYRFGKKIHKPKCKFI